MGAGIVQVSISFCTTTNVYYISGIIYCVESDCRVEIVDFSAAKTQ